MDAAETEIDGIVTPIGRFDLAPPRHFLYPALLLLLARGPNHGYALLKELETFRFGPIDRPSVYRTLGQLERDELVRSAEESSSRTRARRVYEVTDAGRRALQVWMGVIREERDRLDVVLRRYAATDTVAAAMAEVDGWGSDLGPPRSSVSTATALLPPPAVAARRIVERVNAERRRRRSFSVIAERSAVFVEARSTVGPITFGGMGLTGTIEVTLEDGAVVPDDRPTATIAVPVSELRSGNALYDAEIARRVDARRFPLVQLQLAECRAGGEDSRFHISGDVTMHGVTRHLAGSIVAQQIQPGRIAVSGEQIIDVREFDIESPTVLLLRIYPDVAVRMYIEADLDPFPPTT